MKIYANTKFFLIAPANFYTGGPLSLHELASALKRLGYEVYMVYYGAQNDSPVHPWFKKFHIPVATVIEDKPENIIISPETIPYFVMMLKKIQMVVWWMSVDNYLIYLIEDMKLMIESRTFLKRWTTPMHTPDFTKVEHLHQSEYARLFLKVNNIPDNKILHELRGYLAQSFYDNESKIDVDKKENIVVFNPKKGFEFTKQIFESADAKGLVVAPIQNMSPEQVQDLLARAKVYIDFGFHPGRERIPREATLSHCVVITGRRGSAENPIDIPIDEDFKFEDKPENIPKIIEKIRYVFENFKAEHDRQNSYREIILHERDYFFQCVDEVFANLNADKAAKKIRTGIAGDLQEIEKMCDHFINDPSIKLLYAVNDQLAGKIIKYKDLLEIEVISGSDAEFLLYEKRLDQVIMKRPK